MKKKNRQTFKTRVYPVTDTVYFVLGYKSNEQIENKNTKSR